MHACIHTEVSNREAFAQTFSPERTAPWISKMTQTHGPKLREDTTSFDNINIYESSCNHGISPSRTFQPISVTRTRPSLGTTQRRSARPSLGTRQHKAVARHKAGPGRHLTPGSAMLLQVNPHTAMPTRLCNPHLQHALHYLLHIQAPSSLLIREGHWQHQRGPEKRGNPSLHATQFAKGTAFLRETITVLTPV